MKSRAWWRDPAAVLPLLACVALAQPAWPACAPNQPGCQPERPAPPAQQHFEAPRAAPQQHFEAPRSAPQQHFEAPRPQPQPQQHFEAPRPQPQQFQPHPQAPAAHPEFQHPAPSAQQPQFHQPAPPQQQHFAPSPGQPPHGGEAFRAPQQRAAAPERDSRAGHYSYRGHEYERFRAEPYRWPAGMHYERYRVGARLPLAFLISSFIIADWAAYGLAPPPYGYEWVRYGPDVLLVDPNTGLIQDAAYSAFVDSTPEYAAPPPGYAGAADDSARPLGSFGAWSAAMNQEGSQTVCYAFSPAFGSSSLLPGRSAPMLTVTQRPGLRDVVSVSEGMAMPVNAPVSAQVDGAIVPFYANGAMAYASNGALAVSAFQRGNRVDVTMPGPDGRPLTDSFNLIGFSSAYATISQACPY